MKKYVLERGTERIEALFRGQRDLAISRISHVEVPAALARRAREGDLPHELARRHARQFQEDADQMRIVEPRTPVFRIASTLVWEHRLRAYDALQLAAAVHLKQSAHVALTFLAADGPLCTAAEAQPFKVERLG